MRRKHGLLLLLAMAAVASFAISPAAFGGPSKTSNHCAKKFGKKKCNNSKQGRMTGHGNVITERYGLSQHEFRNSVCGSDRFPDLKVRWDGGKFELTSYSSPLRCIDTAFDEGQPRAGFDTIVGQGTGTYNGQSGATARFMFVDAGEPGVNDQASIQIFSAGGELVFELVNETIHNGGNHQAHR